MELKQALYNHCFDVLNNRLKVIQTKISDLQNALQSETKSTAGDKHETGRAMVQLEREKAGQQLAELQKQIKILNRLNTNTKHEKVALGSLVKTTKANYFISVSLGEVKIERQSFFCISAATPIGKLLLSKSVNDTVNFNSQEFEITEII